MGLFSRFTMRREGALMGSFFHFANPSLAAARTALSFLEYRVRARKTIDLTALNGFVFALFVFQRTHQNNYGALSGRRVFHSTTIPPSVLPARVSKRKSTVAECGRYPDTMRSRIRSRDISNQLKGRSWASHF